MALTIETAALEAMRGHIKATLKEIGDGMSQGALKSFEDYKFEAGRCQGLRDALDLCDTIEKDLAER